MRRKDEFSDEITDTLDGNIHEIGRVFGPSHTYVKILDLDLTRKLISNLKQSEIDSLLDKNGLDYDEFDNTLPWIILTDKNPDDIEEGDQCIKIELGHLTSKREVSNTVRQIAKSVREDNFRELNMKNRKRKIESNLPESVNVSSLAISVVGLFI